MSAKAAKLIQFPTSLDQNSDIDGLALCVRAQLKDYFEALDGQLPSSGFYHKFIQEVERPLLSAILEKTRGNQKLAAEILGINRNTLSKKIKDLDIKL